MCEYCDQVNCAILSLHNEFVLDSKGNEYGYSSLSDFYDYLSAVLPAVVEMSFLL
jgi:hypothetical protein